MATDPLATAHLGFLVTIPTLHESKDQLFTAHMGFLNVTPLSNIVDDTVCIVVTDASEMHVATVASDAVCIVLLSDD